MPNQPSTVLARPNRTPDEDRHLPDQRRDDVGARRRQEEHRPEEGLGEAGAVDQQRQPEREGERRRHDERGEHDEGDQAGAERRVGQHVGVVAQPDERRRGDGVAGVEEAEQQAPRDRARRRRRAARGRTGRRRPRTTGCGPAVPRSRRRARSAGRRGSAGPRWSLPGRGVVAVVILGVGPGQPATRLSSASATALIAAICCLGSAPLLDDAVQRVGERCCRTWASTAAASARGRSR